MRCISWHLRSQKALPPVLVTLHRGAPGKEAPLPVEVRQLVLQEVGAVSPSPDRAIQRITRPQPRLVLLQIMEQLTTIRTIKHRWVVKGVNQTRTDHPRLRLRMNLPRPLPHRTPLKNQNSHGTSFWPPITILFPSRTKAPSRGTTSLSNAPFSPGFAPLSHLPASASPSPSFSA